jgi:hypothetical protein
MHMLVMLSSLLFALFVQAAYTRFLKQVLKQVNYTHILEVES